MINLINCENLLREAYYISDEEKIYMRKIDVIDEGYDIPYVKYDVYSKLNGSSLVKLNLTICKNSKVDIFIPIAISESLDKLNTSSGYFNDICYISSSNSGTDITLKDRKEEFIEGKKEICQEGCDFTDYDYNNKKAQCSCDVKESSNNYADMKFDEEKIFKNFIDIKNIANINILKCYKSLFSQNGIIRNIGSYIIISIILFHIISIFIFYKYQFDEIKDKINDIILGKGNSNKSKNVETKNIKKQKPKNNNKIISTINPNYKRNKIIKKVTNKKIFPLKNKINMKKFKPQNNTKIYGKRISNNIINMNNVIITKNSNNKNIFKSKFKINKKEKEITKYNEKELNELDYELALKYDHRSCCQYYISLIKTKHNLIFSFFYNNDYNSKIIKIDLFFISFIMNFTINALFFNDDTMHKIYKDKGKFQFLFQLPQMIYSSITSSALGAILQLLALSEDDIIKFKQNKDTNNINERKRSLIYRLNIKVILFFIISTIFLLMFWYYLSMFCAIYMNITWNFQNSCFIR